MPYDINSQQIDIENLFKQNANDLSSIKELYRKIEKINNEISLLKKKGQIIDKINNSNNNNSLKEIMEEINSLKSELTIIRSNIKKAIFIEPVTQQTIPCTNISLNKTSLSFSTYTQQTLSVNVSPSNTTDSIVWNSSNNNVASVNNGVVIAVGNGSCVISVSCGSQLASCNINVNIDSTIVTTKYTITNNLTNVSNSNSASNINENSSYTATLTPSDGYEIGTVTITMGGNDITSSVYSNGNINITNVTGNIVINATATEISSGVVEFTPFGNFVIGQLSSSSGTSVTTSYTKAVSCINTGELNSGCTIGFNDNSFYSSYKFAYGLKTGAWITGSGGAYHTENRTISETGSYGVMILKINSADFTESDLSEINSKFGIIAE